MDTKRNCAERMRPILRAMEQSISAARSQRTHQPQTPNATGNSLPSPFTRPAPAATNNTTSHTPVQNPNPNPNLNHNQTIGTPHPAVQTDNGGRLKAKPKRFEGTLKVNPFPDTGYRSQAG